MTDSEAVEMLRAYHKCQILQVKGIYEDCNEQLCDNCDLCYAQGNTGEHIESIEIAIQALEKQIEMKKYCEWKLDDNNLMTGCGDYFNLYDNCTGKFKYCPRCGKKILIVESL